MTLKEAREAALARVPVECDGVVYERIIAVGYKYPEQGAEIPSVCLKDKSGHSTTDAAPARVRLVENPPQEAAV